MKTIIIGGSFGDTPKKSSIVSKLSESLNSESINGGSLDNILNVDLSDFDLTIWLPNIDNSVEKQYPRKKRGSVLICTKVLRENRDFGDAVARIFKMNANAVIAIDKSGDLFKFSLIDALGNIWVSTTDIEELVIGITGIYD